jgi:hypothetical protein
VIVGTLLLRLHLPEARSLKDKRQVVSSLMSRLRNRYGVSVAELSDLDVWQSATLGVACVSSSESVCRRLLGDLERWVEGAGPFEVVDTLTEMR